MAHPSTTSSPPDAFDDVTVEGDAAAMTWLARNVRHVCDGRDRDTVRSETTSPSFSNSPWIRGAPQRLFSAAIWRIKSRQCASMRPAKASRATAPPSSEPIAMPTFDGGRLDQHQRVSPPRPRPSQDQPQQTVRCAKAPIRTSEHSQLVAQARVSRSRSRRVAKANRIAATVRRRRPMAPRMVSYYAEVK